ncbi:uncharacterized protein AB675_7369 [Cyphellophora attinorum]|uniref:Uncharacterized protein n=1 Tax=Cyphellophora attinorum TaxID=1664694 RepID=A0A0N0NJ89_9EURO|nr:uncharacterized protein AB675_7369 [Phialophora attinorum]KPI36339.1 hypothetical protein AB675_7369 [Phialophora attinorum]
MENKAIHPPKKQRVQCLTIDSPRKHAISDWMALIDEDNSAGAAKGGSLANSAALVDLPLPCARDDEVGMSRYQPTTALSHLTGVTSQAVKHWTIVERYLLNHFMQSVSRALVVVEDQDNIFLLHFVPMALQNLTVRRALLALSACHTSKVYPIFEHDVLVQRTEALCNLKTELADHDRFKWAIGATLLLCLVEICEGNSQKWLLHLHGARTLLTNTLSDSLQGPPLAILKELYNYICCIASVNSITAPPVLWPLSGTDVGASTVHPLFGSCGDLYHCLAEINDVAAEMDNASPAEHQSLRLREIELSLQSWTPAEESQKSRYTSELRAAGFANQWAIMIRLQQVANKSRNDDPRITKAAEHILSALSLIRPGSDVEPLLLFPLFMAGLGSTTKPSRLTVEHRFTSMEATIGLGNIVIAHKLLDEIWRRANDGDVVDWQALTRARYPGLILF